MASHSRDESLHTLICLIEAQDPRIFLAIGERFRNVCGLEQFRTGTDGQNRLAMAVLVSNSKLPESAQEKLIADLARAAFDAYSTEPPK